MGCGASTAAEAQDSGLPRPGPPFEGNDGQKYVLLQTVSTAHEALIHCSLTGPLEMGH